jgi:hypothetical protein
MQIQTNNANFININILGNIGDVIVSLLAVGVLDLSSKKKILTYKKKNSQSLRYSATMFGTS